MIRKLHTLGMLVYGLFNNYFMKKFGILLIVLNFMYCGPIQFRMEYDNTLNAVKACDDLIIKNLSIWEKDSYDIGYCFYLIEGEKGSSMIFLDKYNIGYETNDKQLFKFKPNKEYVVSVAYFGTIAEIILFTNQYAEVDSVINNFSCLK
jgi:hypothetical protein